MRRNEETGNTPWLVGVGHCCQDTICTVEAYPPEDGSTHITAMDDSRGGGAVATALVAASKLGIPSAVIANLGDDDNGRRMEAEFRACGINTRGIRQIAGGRSSTSFVMVDPRHGTRTKFPYRDSLPPISFDEPLCLMIRKAKVLHLDGTRHENAMEAALLAKQYGVTVSLDGCSVEQDVRKTRALAELADILIVNAKYPARVTGRENLEDALRDLAALGTKQAVIATFGREGCYAWQDGTLRHYPAFEVTAVDTTGAGDVFHGAYLAAYLEGMAPDARIRFASAVSALKCGQPGGRRGIPTRGETDAFLQSH